MNPPRYVVITPVRNEAAHVGRTIDSMASQTVLPRQWILVDDGSIDGTDHILETASRKHSWITAIRRPDRGFRKSGGGVVEAFYDGYAAIDSRDWEFIVKLDGDLSFEPDYFECCLSEFVGDPKLGIGGGNVHGIRDGRWQIDSPGDPPFHVRGATKIYRRTCWEQICPLLHAPGWDTVDEIRANMYGWNTRTFPGFRVFQHKATGAADGAWSNWFKNGRANYITGYHPLFMFAKCIKRAWAPPRLVAAVALGVGFCSGYFVRLPRGVDNQAVRYLRRQQLRRLLLRTSIYRSAEHRP